MSTALIILPQGFEEIEAISVINLLRRANISLTVASLNYPLQVTGRSRVDLIADGALSEYTALPYDLVVLPGGPGHVEYLTSSLLQNFLKSHKGFIGAICAAPLALHEFGLLKGKKYTCHASVRNQLTASLEDPVVVDGKIITSTGAGTSFAFGLKLVEMLEGADAAAQLALATAYKG